MVIITAALALARAWWKAALGAVLMFGPAFLLGQCSGAANQRVKDAAALDRANAAAQRIINAANELAANERLKDALRLGKQQKDRIDAIEAAPPSRTGAATHALGCQRLRQAGLDREADAAGCGH